MPKLEATKTETIEQLVKPERAPWSTPRVLVSELDDSTKAGIVAAPEATGGLLS